MSVSAGSAASDGVLLGMVEASDAAEFMAGPEIRDWSMLAGVRSRGDRSAITRRLHLKQLRIQSFPPHQLPVCPLLHDLAMLQDDDPIRHAHRREAV